MSFRCQVEIEVAGGTEEERRALGSLVLAADSVDEDTASSRDGPVSLTLGFECSDGLPEAELSALTAQFPALSATMLYFSRDGEFFGYLRAGASGEAAESADFGDGTLDEVGRRHDGDRMAFVRAFYSLARAGE